MNIFTDFEECFGYDRNKLLERYPKNDRELQKHLFDRGAPYSDETAKTLYLSEEYLCLALLYTSGLDIVPVCPGVLMTDLAPRDGAIMEYGVGSGYTLLALYESGYRNLTGLDIPNGIFSLFKYHCQKYKKEIKTIDITIEGFPVMGEYDYIICNEVLEHCWDPVATLAHIVKSLKQGGLIYLSTFFNDIGGETPLHLAHLNKYQDTELWFNEVHSLGLEDYRKDSNNILKVWRKR